MEIKVNDYVRTDKGEIGKVSSVMKENLGLGFGDIEACNTEPYVYGTIIKSSPKIIDLIEVGDYVNGCRITYIDEPNKYNSKRILNYEEPEDYVLRTFDNEDIKSIVTKEMFEQMEYKVGE